MTRLCCTSPAFEHKRKTKVIFESLAPSVQTKDESFSKSNTVVHPSFLLLLPGVVDVCPALQWSYLSLIICSPAPALPTAKHGAEVRLHHSRRFASSRGDVFVGFVGRDLGSDRITALRFGLDVCIVCIHTIDDIHFLFYILSIHRNPVHSIPNRLVFSIGRVWLKNTARRCRYQG